MTPIRSRRGPSYSAEHSDAAPATPALAAASRPGKQSPSASAEIASLACPARTPQGSGLHSAQALGTPQAACGPRNARACVIPRGVARQRHGKAQNDVPASEVVVQGHRRSRQGWRFRTLALFAPMRDRAVPSAILNLGEHQVANGRLLGLRSPVPAVANPGRFRRIWRLCQMAPFRRPFATIGIGDF
jgi:hypothetical protein